MWDPTGHWGTKLHQDLTKYAFNAIKSSDKYKKYLTDKSGSKFKIIDVLLYYCVRPDKIPKGMKKRDYEYTKGWHGGGKGAWKTRLKECRQDFASNYKNNAQEAFKQMGLGLHVIQDSYAHNYTAHLDNFKDYKMRQKYNGKKHAKKRDKNEYDYVLKKKDGVKMWEFTKPGKKKSVRWAAVKKDSKEYIKDCLKEYNPSLITQPTEP